MNKLSDSLGDPEWVLDLSQRRKARKEKKKKILAFLARGIAFDSELPEAEKYLHVSGGLDIHFFTES